MSDKSDNSQSHPPARKPGDAPPVLGDVRPDTRIVVQLEQRQVFFVLMGILVLASGILVLGYVLGLNVATPATMSARALTEGRRAERSVVRQPAASDDKVELTFHEKVMSPSPAAEPLPEAPSAQEQARRGALAKAAVAKAAAAKRELLPWRPWRSWRPWR